jgi:molybdopterin-guanine dinucleotide biosynthesis protein A
VTRDAGLADVVLPVVGGHRQPLAASYATSLAGAAARLVSEDRLKVGFLFDEATVVRLDEPQLLADPALSAVDPGLASVSGANTVEEYDALHAQPEPEVTVELSGALVAGGLDRGRHTVRASTLGSAAASVSVHLDRHVLAAVNGDQASRDPEFPLVRGDLVTLMSAGAGG